MPLPIVKFKDLDLNLTPHPISGDIIPLEGFDAIQRSLKNIILTNVYEAPFRPNKGSKAYHLLFEPADPLTKYALRDEIYRAILLNEPRVQVFDVIVNWNEDENRYDVEINFSIANFTETISVNVFLERVR